VPGYDLLGVLGRGGMGVVYKARHQKLNRLVALKMILAGGHAGEAELARFRTEAEAVARLQHPGVVQIYDVGEHNGLPYLALEYCDGGSLAGRLGGTPLPPAQAAALVEQLARAIEAAHQQQVIHRDLKPANVLLTGGPDIPIGQSIPKVTDFGLAKKLDEASGQTQTGAILGTPSYMAPEQACGKGKQIGPAVDVYALGAILYECLTGRPPFRAATTMDTVLQVLNDEPVPTTQLQQGMPCDLDTICMKCLQKDPQRRYATAVELAEDLRRFLSGESVRARPVGTAERAVKWVRRRPAVAGLLAVLILLSATASGSLAWQYGQVVTQRDNYLTQKEIAQQKEVDALFQKGVADENAGKARQAEAEAKKAEARAKEAADKLQDALAATQRALTASKIQLADATLRDPSTPIGVTLNHLDEVPPDQRFWEWHYLKRKASGGLLTLYGHIARVDSVAYSPDGRRLASGSGDGTVKVWDAQSGAELLTLRTTWPVKGVTFSPDGQRLASVGEPSGTVKVWNVQRGTELLALRGGIVDGFSPFVAYSPDGQQLATGGSFGGTVYLRDAQSGAVRLSLRGTPGVVFRVAYSPDGRRLASSVFRTGGTSDGDYKVNVWDAQSGVKLLTLSGHDRAVSSLAFNSDGRRLATGSADGTVKAWDAQSGAELLALTGLSGEVNSVTYSPDGRLLATAAGADGAVKLWDPNSGADLLTFKGHTGTVLSVAFSPDGQRLVTGGLDATVKVWDVRGASEPLALKGHTRSIASVAFSPSSLQLASGGGDATVTVWNAQRGTELFTLKGHAREVRSIAFSPDGRQLASGSADSTVRVWDARNGTEQIALRSHISGVTKVAYSPDGRRLASGSVDGRIKVWDAQNWAELLTLKAHTDGVTSISFSPDGQKLASGSRDNTVKIWDTRGGTELLTLKGHTSGVNAVAFSPDGGQLASNSDEAVRIWNANNGAEVLALKGHTGSVTSVAFSPDGRRLISGSNGRDRNSKPVPVEMKVWDTQTGQELLTLRGHTGPVLGVTYSPDGWRLASVVEGSGTVRVWHARSSAAVLALKGHTRSVYSTAFSPDGQQLVSGSGDTTVKLWDVRSGVPLLTLKGHTAGVNTVAFSPHGKHLASGSEDTTVKVWDAQSGAELLTFKEHTGTVSSVAFSPDGQQILSSDYSGKTLVWNMKDGKILPEAKKAVGTGDRRISLDGKRLALIDGSTVHIVSLEAPDDWELGYRAWATRPDPAWHLEVASKEEQAGHRFAAAFHLRQAVANSPPDGRLYARLGWVEAQLCRWHAAADAYVTAAALDPFTMFYVPDPGAYARGEWAARSDNWKPAATAFARAVRYDPNDLANWQGLLYTSLALGHHELYRSCCVCMLDRFGQTDDAPHTNDLAYWSTLMPDTLEDPRRAVQLAERAVAKERSPIYLKTLGAALHRAGRHEEAIKVLQADAEVQDWLFLALCHHRLNHPSEARQWLDKAAAFLNKAKTSNWQQSEGKWWLLLDWHKRLELQLLRKEAEALILRK
jgi:WD40 repeat protein/tetratricopeptide (TPR) repeat protein/tRNA A-37 threonylcarbamoyl transferase component Bud32